MRAYGAVMTFDVSFDATMWPATSEIVDAYRADLNHAERDSLGEHDADWLIVGSILQHAAHLRAPDRPAYLTVAAAELERAVPHASPGDTVRERHIAHNSDAAIARIALTVATDAENAGAFAVATTILDHARMLLAGEAILLRGRLLNQQARILRKIGELAIAQEQFKLLVQLGAEHTEDELTCLGLIGQAAVDRHRGNYPKVRELISQVLAIPASTPEISALRAHAYHSMLVAAAVAGDYDTALCNGALAIGAAANEDARLELLQNLASVCYDMGEFRAGLHASLRVLGESTIARVRMAAYGTAALAAARLGDAITVRALAKSADSHLRGNGIEHAIADLARELFEAFAWLGEVALAKGYRAIALQRATEGKYFEILHRLDAFRLPAGPAERVELASTAREVADELGAGDSRELLSLALSGAR